VIDVDDQDEQWRLLFDVASVLAAENWTLV
jgi:hypothetical protein